MQTFCDVLDTERAAPLIDLQLSGGRLRTVPFLAVRERTTAEPEMKLSLRV